MPGYTNSDSHKSGTIQSKGGIWRTYDGTDGLPAGILCLLQDRQGYLWLGTQSGLCRYDGASFITYTTDDGLPNDSVISLCEDSQGYLWLGTFGGVSRYDGERFVTYAVEGGPVDELISSICEDSRGRLWFGTGQNGVFCCDGEDFTNYTTKDGLVSNNISSICEDSQGRMWFSHGTGMAGVSCFDRERFTNYTTQDGLAHNRVEDICEDNKKRLWFATWGANKVSCYDGQRFINYTTEDGLAHSNVCTIHKDKQGRLWFGTRGGGVCCFDGNSFTTYTNEDGLLDNRVFDIIQDQEGSFWFAHFHSGLSRFDPETTQLLTEAMVSRTLIQTNKGHLWFASTANQVCYLYGGEKRCQNFPSRVFSLLEDSQRRFWVGTTGTGIYFYDSTDAVWEGKYRHFTTEDGLSDNMISYIIEARNRVIWVGTLGTGDSPGCLCRFDGSRFEAIQTAHPMIKQLFEDKCGRIWMGGYSGGGLSYLESPSAMGKEDSESEDWKASLKNYTTEDGLPSNNILSIVEDDAGRLWIGLWNDLYCFHADEFIPYGEEISYYGGYWISARDVNGQLWFGTLGNGIYRYNGRHFQQLSKKDGLPNNTSAGFIPQPDGSMIIGTLNGIVHYHPTANEPPRIEIREVVADQVYLHPDELELTTTGADLVTIAYHGLGLSTHRMRYSYILEGYDKEWRDTWESQIRYEKLPPGEYTFRVIAINRDLVCSEAPATLQLTIVPDPRNHRIAQLEKELSERERAEFERMQQELEDAHDMQMSLMPKTSPTMEGFEIAGFSKPAREVGGDFFDYFTIADGKLGIALADVSGKGLKGAMNAVMTNGMLHTEAKMQTSCGRILTALNASLCPRMMKMMFTALELAIIDKEQDLIHLANAAQPYPMLKRNNEVSELKTDSGLPLGMTRNVEYGENQFNLESGDTVVFYTDGLIEAENESGEMYGTERLEQFITKINSSMSGEELIKAIIQDVTDFAGTAEQYDDITVVVVKRL